MKFEFSSSPLATISSDVILVFAFQTTKGKKTTFKPLNGFTEIDASLGGKLTKLCLTEQFSGKRKEHLIYYPDGQVLASKIIIVGLGNEDEFIGDDLRRAMGSIAKKLHYSCDSISMVLPQVDALDVSLSTQLIAEGLLLGTYAFGKYKEQSSKDHVLTLAVISGLGKEDIAVSKKAIAQATLFSQATRVARDLVNEQPSVATPTYLANFAKDIAKSSPFVTCKVFDREQAEKMGMHAFLGIARGSDTPPQFIVLSYTPKKEKGKKKLALIGKGITFDSGGVNVKPGDHMSDMKMDMAGGAAVLGVFSVIAAIKPDYPVIGIIAATPNLISGKSIVPGDVVTAMNGKTIEIINTDAEGRVTMADSLSYAVQEGATEIIDLATLTGACIVALGDDYAGLFPTNQDLASRVKAAAFDAGEKVWEMPMDRDYKEQNNSSIADIGNLAKTRYGGAITAGLFLAAFVNKVPFVHLDIAGPAFTTKGNDISVQGGTGFGVRTLLHLLAEGGK